MKFTNKQRIAASAVTAAMAMTLPLAAFASFSPDRQTYTCTTPTVCHGASHVQFNSFTNAPNYGDERAFFDGKDAVINSAGGYQDLIQVHDGEEVLLRVYIHNNADIYQAAAGTDTVAHNVKLHVVVPTATNLTQMNSVAFLSADNAAPLTINDTATLKGERPFGLTYVAGSAKFEHKPDGVTGVTAPVSDSIVTTGANLGDVKGCFQYAGFVTLKVKVSMPGAPVTVTTTPPAPVPTPAPTPAPVTPAALPQTGPEMGLAGLAGSGAIAYAASAYRRSRKALAETLLNRK